MNYRSFFILLVACTLSFFVADASHIVGGEFSYVFIGDSTSGGTHYDIYSVSLSIYEDCLNGSPEAIAQDNPAFFGVFYPIAGGNYETYELDTFSDGPHAIFFTPPIITVPVNFSNACVSNIPATCLLKKTFQKTYALPSNGAGYIIAYQRCCRNASIVNVFDPSNTGSTFYCSIPQGTLHNNSAVFKNYPPQVICLNNPLSYDNSATDVDGDSLSYGFYSPLDGAEGSSNSKPDPVPPPYDTVSYVSPWSSQVPMTGSPAIHINPTTGLITGTPNLIGRYLVGVYCAEWRNGILININRREFQFVVTPCTKTVVANIPQYSTDFNTYIVDCANYTVHFINTSTGGFSYSWDFGVQGTTGDTSNEFEPSFTYPDTGTYTVKLVVNPGSSCPDSIERYVKVYPQFVAAFSDSGRLCPGDTIHFKDLTDATIKPITFWNWNFGDGHTDTAENPVHTYSQGGTYNVILVSENVKDCIDTALRQVVVETFKPFAGDDTVIVKGSNILFNAQGGVTYAWTPSTNLNDTAIYDPLGVYPDTGMFIYTVHVVSTYGCSGNDSIKVHVISSAEFIVPNAFTPNGDGKNDYFKPVAVGYSALKYFTIFNRWGQVVYNSTSFETGWDGTFNNVKCDIGTYYWELKYVDRYGKEGTMKGDVTLIR